DHVGNLKKHRFLRAAGYRLIRRFENNGWYVRATRRSAWRHANAGISLANIILACRSASRATRREPCAGGCASGRSRSLGYHRALEEVELSRPAAAMPASADVAGETEGRCSGALGGSGQAFISS